VLKRRSIDKYIQQVTAGLPQLERVDTAAEIRVHLLQKTRELMAQGFPREEAEHLAVQEMGPIASTNRALLGHMFTPKLGWITLGVLALGLLYLERHRFIWPDTTVRGAAWTLEEVAEFKPLDEDGSRRKLSFVLPRGTRSFEYALVSTRHHSQNLVLNDVEDAATPEMMRENRPIPDWSKPVTINMSITEYTDKRVLNSFRVQAVRFQSEQVNISQGMGTTVAQFPNEARVIGNPGDHTFRGARFTTDRNEMVRQLELNKWFLIETSIVEKTKWKRNSRGELTLVPVGLRGVNSIAIRANDRPIMQVPRSQLRIVRESRTWGDTWRLVGKHLTGQRKELGYDGSMDESLRKEIGTPSYVMK
jgi:hypothetical protein